MKEFMYVTDCLRTYLSQNQYCDAMIKANERCFRKLGHYLEENGVDYSPDAADEWLTDADRLIANNDRRCFRNSVLRLRDIYENGYILPEHETRQHQTYSILSDSWKNILDDYLLGLGKNLAPKTVAGHKYQCARFLIYVQKQGAVNIDDITFEMLVTFYYSVMYRAKKGGIRSNAAKVSSMLVHFYEQGKVPYSFTIIMHYLVTGNKQGCYWNTVSEEAHAAIAKQSKAQEAIDTSVLVTYKEAILKEHRENEYSKTIVTLLNRTVDLLIMFLEMNSYLYTPGIARIWLSELRDQVGTETRMMSRALNLIADYHTDSKIKLEKMYRSKPSAFSSLPEWCKEAATSYVDTKIREGWERSTLDMIRSSISRFCKFLDSTGLRSFSELNAAHVKLFNATDVHKTPQGKNAYNTRIRKFLIYLGEKGLLENPMLFIALPRTSAPKETIVVILTEDEMAELNMCLENDEGPLSLRKKAMLLLGLKMGLRGSDIVNLEIDDVDWNTASIRFIQKKTSVEVNLPMPNDVGNALFRYITEERKQKDSPNIFLTEKAPHRPISRQACRKALITALPNRKVEGSGFHVTRKTYATGLLKNGVGAEMVAEALGQRDTSSVHRYLSLDAERMKMCSIPMDCFGLRGWSHDE